MQTIVASLASILATFGIAKHDRVHVDPRYMDSAAHLFRSYGEHPYSFRLGSASGSDGDIPGRIFSFCSGEVILVIFPVFSIPGQADTWTDRSQSYCLTCAAAEAQKNPNKARRDGIQCRAACFYVSRDTAKIERTWNGNTTERSETILHVAIPG